MIVSYPNPHHIRRNFTLYPLEDPNLRAAFPGDPPADFMINTTMTKQNVDFIVNSFEGDFFGFQTYFAALQVSLALPV
jgi:hypothetical protein